MKSIYLHRWAKAFILLFLTMNSCGLMKKTEKTLQESSAMLEISKHTKSNYAQENNSNSVYMVFEKDSVQQAYQVQLWPKGKFTFSAVNGFEGEAERILISGELQKKSNHLELSTSQQHNKEQQQMEMQVRKTQKEAEKIEKKSSSADFRWVIMGIILLVFGGIWLYRRCVF